MTIPASCVIQNARMQPSIRRIQGHDAFTFYVSPKEFGEARKP